jgi:hypothetical protein
MDARLTFVAIPRRGIAVNVLARASVAVAHERGPHETARDFRPLPATASRRSLTT